MHLSPLQTKPFNPILGETFQIKVGDLDLYFEQVLHKPPTCAFYGLSKNYSIHGHTCIEAKTGANSVKANVFGKYNVSFFDGYSYELKPCQVIVKGINVGKRTFNFRRSGVVIDKVKKMHIIYI